MYAKNLVKMYFKRTYYEAFVNYRLHINYFKVLRLNVGNNILKLTDTLNTNQ